MLLLIDNYDSFVHNLARYFVELGCETRVVRNDAVTVADVRSQQHSADKSFAPTSLFTAEHLGFVMTNGGCSRTCRTRSARRGITRSSSMR